MKHPTKLLEWAFDDDIAELIAEVRAQERERCVRLCASIIHENSTAGARFAIRKAVKLIRRPDDFQPVSLSEPEEPGKS